MLVKEINGPVARLTIDRPEVRNALNDELIAALSAAFDGMSAGVRAVVLASTGTAFCAGGDLNWMRRAANYTEEQNYEDALRLARLFEAMVPARFVVIGRVQGAAYGGGAGLVAACDVAVASDEARFAFSETKLGLEPSTISSVVLPKIGSGHARALFTTGEAFDAERALRIGLVHEVVPADALDLAVEAKVKHVLSSGPEAIAQSKALALDGPYSAEDSARRLARIRATPEGREGVEAFLDKRKAKFVSEPE